MKQLVWIPSVAVLIITAIYAAGVINGVPLGDEWRWMVEMLIPLEEGKISLFKYAVGEYSFLSHSHYLAVLFMLFDKNYLNMDFSWFAYVGLVFYVAGFGLLAFYAKTLGQQPWKIFLPASLIAACGYSCITSDFPWLFVVFEYVYFFLALLLLVIYDFYLRQKLNFMFLLPVYLVCFIFADSIGIVAVLVVLSVQFLLCLFKRESWVRLVVLFAPIMLILIVERVFLGKGVPVGGYERSVTILALIHHPADILISFFSVFVQPMLDMVVLQVLFGEQKFRIFQFAIGLVFFQLSVVTLMLWIKREGFKQTLLPLLLLLFSLLTWALILMSRYLDSGVYAMDMQRYVRNFTLIYVALGFMFLTMKHDKVSKAVLTLVFVSAFGCYLASAKFQYANKINLDKYFAQAKVELKRQPIDSKELAKYIDQCKSDYCNPAIDYLRERKLSIFKE